MESRSWYQMQRELERIRTPQAESPESNSAKRRKAAMDRLKAKQQKAKEPQ